MTKRIGQVTLVVRDYDEAIDFYVGVLGFDLIEDTILSEHKRWVIVAPPGVGGCSLLLAKGVGVHQESRIGDQTGGRVFLFLYTDDLDRDYVSLCDHKVTIVRSPATEIYGRVLVFADLYGNLWDLIEPIATFD
ncbi:MAG: VOC family protein [Saprospiraceae bacterium]|nr:VOC family protein [Saprospiraceae bacterium]